MSYRQTDRQIEVKT